MVGMFDGTRPTKYFRVCLSCLEPISSETPCCTMAKFCTQTRTDHVQNICCVLYPKESSSPKKWHFSTKIPESRPTDSQRHARRGHWPRPVLLIALLLIAQAAYGAACWLPACRAVTDLSGKQLVLYKPDNFTLTTRASLFHAENQWVASLTFWKLSNFGWTAVAPNVSFPRSLSRMRWSLTSPVNTMTSSINTNPWMA